VICAFTVLRGVHRTAAATTALYDPKVLIERPFMNAPTRSPKNVAIDVYLSEGQVARITELAAKHGRSNSSVCRELIAAALDGGLPSNQLESLKGVAATLTHHGALLDRIETLVGAAVVAPAIAAMSADTPPEQRLAFTREVLAQALAASPRVRMRLGAQVSPQAGGAPHA
jgi:plasmid stability protein